MTVKYLQFMLAKEWLLYALALVLAYITSLILFLVLNNSYDRQLNRLMEGELASEQEELAFKFYQLQNADQWQGAKVDGKVSPEAINEMFNDQFWKSLATNVSPKPELIKNLNRLMLYGREDATNHKDVRQGFLLPYINAPSVSLKEVMDSLDWRMMEEHFGEGADNAKKFFSSDLSDQLDQVQVTSSYTYRRYLNGSIQFLTFVVAFMGMYLLFSLVISVWIEKESLREGIDSFELPSSMDNYQIGQLEDTLKNLRELQSNFQSTLREMLINTVSTFNWRGKEEAENTLNIEVQELRERLDSRLGMIKYFAWAVPSIGFIGTVVGIGNALGNAHNVIGQRAEYQTKGEIQVITGQLGIAFDTTLISLLLSIFLVLLIHVLTRREEHLISSAVSRVKRDLLQKIAPLERANKLRRFNLLLESLKSHTSPAELQSEPFVTLKNHLEDELNVN